MAYESLESKEWLVTNGLGGYASSSVAGANTRRYHGLLVAAHNPPTDRQVLVSKVEETIVDENDTFELSSNRYGTDPVRRSDGPDVIHPNGWQYVASFDRLPLPRWVYQAGRHTLIKTVFMVQNANTTVIAYQNSGAAPFTIRLNPLLVYRDYHSLFHQNQQSNFHIEPGDHWYRIYAQYGAEPVHMAFSAGQLIENRTWYNRFTYYQEQQRGLDYQEDAYSIGTIHYQLAAGETLFLTFSGDPQTDQPTPDLWLTQEVGRVHALRGTQTDTFLQDLVVSANQFIVQRKSTGSETIIAGYHWFTDWGRDTMIALRGLCISLGQQQTAQRILGTFFRYLDDGMLPNRFPDNSHDPIEYNTIDATLWLFVALYEYHQRFDDLPFIEQHFEQLLTILDAHRDGTRYGIHVTEDGLLYGGKGTAQLTWMDARVGDYVVTPRHGCPVEINALWYNALQITVYFAKLLGRKPDMYAMLLRRFESSFRANFWNTSGYLNDVIMPGGAPDCSIRPNQVYALSLPFPLLKLDEQKQVLAVVTEHLYTPYGLRTLSPTDPAFAAVYGGDQWLRDTAYHQGTVWPFLLGEYWPAYLRLNKFSATARKRMHTELATLKEHFYEHDCLFGISEIFDGLHPKEGRGTANQAWSVGALIKLLTDYPAR
ncbi:amylo-alpha-1,6-glucosidase [Spirosoma linguale]|uniref:Glycogen debranching enzyme n=1 Tax=Spirosoma linguale (strain ATCC 33905 / DSM 74 / LMG 10896 / Claus 1) TaxID=504472 RepID=D2QGN2_SPILD|nr:glycogen debranching enzyme [Spirosoma linguale DSM 74]